MLYPRIIPCLLVKGHGLVKTIKFKNPTYVGDPINAVRIFNEKEVDELIMLDIDTSIEKKEPNYKMIETVASECRMPLCYGGGIKTVQQIERIINLGVEKVTLASAAFEDKELVKRASDSMGSQSIVVVIDVKKNGKRYEAYINSGQKRVHNDAAEVALRMAELGVGEIIINSIDNDGLMKGFDLRLVELIFTKLRIPITVLGGAGRLEDIAELFSAFGQIGASAGSLFTFKGQFRAVLINYPNREEKQTLFRGFMKNADQKSLENPLLLT